MTEPPDSRPRSVQTVRGMVVSLTLLVLVALALAGLAGQCSFSPGGPDISGAVAPTVNAQAELHGLARAAAFPVRVPQLPPGWQATSADRDRVGKAPNSPVAVWVGWLTPRSAYLRLSQSSASGADLVTSEIGARPTATGAVRVRQTNWAVYTAPNGERVWVADLGAVRLLITGSAGEPEMRTLATATLAAPIAPR
ncbi:MAG: DUF4245 domain-containing protein [Pseudonocardiaceae bacterium]